MRKLRVWALLFVIALAPAAIAAIPGEGRSRPMIGYWFENNLFPDKSTQMAGVNYWSDYHLEDGTWIGADATPWDGHVNSAGSSLISRIQNEVWAGIGGGFGSWLGIWAGNWAASQVAIDASYASYWLGLQAMAFGPWVGMSIGITVGVA